MSGFAPGRRSTCQQAALGQRLGDRPSSEGRARGHRRKVKSRGDHQAGLSLGIQRQAEGPWRDHGREGPGMQAGQAASFLGPVLLHIAWAGYRGPAEGGVRDGAELGEVGLLAVVHSIRFDSDGPELA